MELTATQPDTLTAENAPARAAAFLAGVPPYPRTFAGRGIVICAGGVRYLTCAWVLINILRRPGCTLPIEVWYLGEEERDPYWIELVEPLGVRCVDAREVSRSCLPPPNSHPRLGGWECKAFAILHCPFEEVLFLDADNVPVVDPTFLFDTPEYRAAGAVFWPDFGWTAPEREAWRVFDVPYRHKHEQESGQILIDKRHGWPALCLCDWYNRHSDFYYRYVYGDKDTFRFAWHRAGCAFAMPERTRDMPFTICQDDFGGRLVFQHRAGDKWSLQGNRRVPGFAHEDACRGYVRELAARWNPLLHALGHLTQADWAEMARWAGDEYRYSLVGRRRWPVRLLPNGNVSGAGPMERYWWCEAGRMMFSRLDRSAVVVLEQQPDGAWQGKTEHYRGAEVRLARTRVVRSEGPRPVEAASCRLQNAAGSRVNGKHKLDGENLDE